MAHQHKMNPNLVVPAGKGFGFVFLYPKDCNKKYLAIWSRGSPSPVWLLKEMRNSAAISELVAAKEKAQ